MRECERRKGLFPPEHSLKSLVPVPKPNGSEVII